jgi:Flp pilus assembly protein TadG
MRTTTTRRPARRLDRRGATLILVSLLTVPLVTLAAFSLDVGWWQVGANQLQTTVDAAALAAARAKQLYPTNNTQSKAVAYANQVASANRAFAQTITIADEDVEPIYWAPETRTATVTNWTDANAVRVTARATPALIFAGVTRGTAPTITRTSVAWIASFNSGVCVKPWSMPYEVLYDKVQSMTGLTSSASSPGNGRRPDLSQEQLAVLTTATYSDQQRIVVVRGPTTSNGIPSSSDGVSAYDGQWIGYSFAGNAGTESFQSLIFGCDPTNVSIVQDGGTTLPGGADYECRTVRALMGSNVNSCTGTWYTEGPTDEVTCHYKAGTNIGVGIASVTAHDGGCYPSASSTTPGVLMQVSWGDVVGTGSNTVDHRMVGMARLLCAFRGLGGTNSSNGNNGNNGGGSANGQGVAVESCSPSGVVPITNLPRGTLVFAIDGIRPAAIGPTTELGNIAGVNQRLILVK